MGSPSSRTGGGRIDRNLRTGNAPRRRHAARGGQRRRGQRCQFGQPSGQEPPLRFLLRARQRLAQIAFYRPDGTFVFLETSARVGGAHIADLVEAATGVNLWVEWARIETAGGIGIGIASSNLISRFAGWPVFVSPAAVGLAFFFSGMVGVFFGFYPAKKAAALSPIDALRYE